jgi:hypothetical protein
LSELILWTMFTIVVKTAEIISTWASHAAVVFCDCCIFSHSRATEGNSNCSCLCLRSSCFIRTWSWGRLLLLISLNSDGKS